MFTLLLLFEIVVVNVNVERVVVQVLDDFFVFSQLSILLIFLKSTRLCCSSIVVFLMLIVFLKLLNSAKF